MDSCGFSKIRLMIGGPRRYYGIEDWGIEDLRKQSIWFDWLFVMEIGPPPRPPLLPLLICMKFRDTLGDASMFAFPGELICCSGYSVPILSKGLSRGSPPCRLCVIIRSYLRVACYDVSDFTWTANELLPPPGLFRTSIWSLVISTMRLGLG